VSQGNFNPSNEIEEIFWFLKGSNYLKDEKLKELQRKYKIFNSLLEQRKKVRDTKERIIDSIKNLTF
jgi:hypothetical protein